MNASGLADPAKCRGAGASGGKPAQVISIFNEVGARMHTHTI